MLSDNATVTSPDADVAEPAGMQGDSTSLERAQVEIRWGGVTHVGKVRRLNEDAMLAAPGVFVVADGMGGHAAGDEASRLVIAAFAAIATGDALALSVIADVIDDANERVRDYAGEHGHDGMGSTVVGALLIDNAGEDSLVVFNVGDARCYVLIDDELTQLTSDHSLVQEMVDQGELAPGQARSHPQRNVVTRAIGIEPSVSADFVVAPSVGWMRLLLCSDGVHGELPDERISAVLRSAESPQAAAQTLIDAVLEGRAADNATAMVVDIERRVDATVLGGGDIESTAPRRIAELLEVTGPRPQRVDILMPPAPMPVPVPLPPPAAMPPPPPPPPPMSIDAIPATQMVIDAIPTAVAARSADVVEAPVRRTDFLIDEVPT